MMTHWTVALTYTYMHMYAYAYVHVLVYIYIHISVVHVHPRFIEGNIYGAYVLHEMRLQFASELDLQLNICMYILHTYTNGVYHIYMRDADR